MDSNSLFNLQDYLNRRKELVDGHLFGYVPPCEGPASMLFEAMRYTLVAGGKRLRPICVLAGADFVMGLEPPEIERGDWAGSRDPGLADALLRAACAAEMIHTYSLIHDDLPCMDDDDLRRGLATCHKVYGEAMALLAGDALLTHAFFTIGQIGDPFKERALDVVRDLADGSGAEGMVAGQAVDLISERMGGGTESHLEFIHRRKTAALFRASLTVGGILAGGNAHDLETLRSVGETVGLIFQVTDDILDVEGTEEELGKTTGRDAELGKLTYPGLLGLETARRRSSELLSKTEDILQTCGPRGIPLSVLAGKITQRRN